jgi:hypothetical protein
VEAIVKMWMLFTGIVALAAVGTAQHKEMTYQSGTILSVQKCEATEASYSADAPTQAPVFTCDLSVRVGGTVLVGRYQSATDYVPGSWTAGSVVQVQTDKHRMYLKGPSGEMFELSILARNHVRTTM